MVSGPDCCKPPQRLTSGNLPVTHQSGPVSRCYPRGVCHCPRNKSRPFQARVWYAGRYWSLGYFASITRAELAVNRVYREMAEWREMQLPPPTLLPLIQQREAARSAQSAPAAQAA